MFIHCSSPKKRKKRRHEKGKKTNLCLLCTLFISLTDATEQMLVKHMRLSARIYFVILNASKMLAKWER